MLQIIDWMGCVYMLVRGIDMIVHAPPIKGGFFADEGSQNPFALFAGIIAIVGAVVFFFMLNAQVDATPSFPAY